MTVPDPTAPLTPTGNLRRRHAVSRLAEACASGAALLAVAVLGVVVYSVAERGAPVLNLGFLIEGPTASGGPGGGIAPVIVGSALLTIAATLMAMPLGILIAIYVTEFAGERTARMLRLALDLINGLPSIVIGLFVFGLLVVGQHQSGFAGAVGLAIIMLPIVARGTQEMLVLVPSGIREAADALGVSRWRTVIGVVLPSALGGIVTATVLAAARAAGETAPLLMATSVFGNTVTLNLFGEAIPNIPVYIFSVSEEANSLGFARAWGAALILLAVILVANLGARALLARNRTRITS